MSVTVSVIIPFYNPPKLRFRKCIESLINQTFEDFEIILVDDGSEEDYSDIINYYIKKDKRIKYIKKNNEGVSAARNTGIEASNGDYVSFIDADDYVENNFLHCMLNAIKDSDLAVCSIEEQWFPTRNKWTDIKTFLMLPTDYAWIQYINFCHNKLYKREIIINNNIRFPKGVKLGEDALFLADYLQAIKSIRIIDKRLYHYIANPSSAVNTYKPEFWNWESSVIERQYELFTTYGLSKMQNMFLIRWLYEKFKYAFYYYIERCSENVDKDKYLAMIRDNALFNKIIESNYNENVFFNKNDKIILDLWKKHNIKGVKQAKRLSQLVKKFRR